MPPGRALDLGCGLGTEAACLAEAGFTAIGVDHSAVAVRRAGPLHRPARFVQADALHLPFASAAFDVLIDQGCFHYLVASDRPRYAAEARRVLRPGGRLFLRACPRTAGERNDIDEVTLQRVFGGWRFLLLERAAIPSDTRMMEALVALLERA